MDPSIQHVVLGPRSWRKTDEPTTMATYNKARRPKEGDEEEPQRAHVRRLGDEGDHVSINFTRIVVVSGTSKCSDFDMGVAIAGEQGPVLSLSNGCWTTVPRQSGQTLRFDSGALDSQATFRDELRGGGGHSLQRHHDNVPSRIPQPGGAAPRRNAPATKFFQRRNTSWMHREQTKE